MQQSEHTDIIKIDFILEIWVILQQSDQEAADSNHVSEREEYNVSEGKDNTKKEKNCKLVFTGSVLHINN